MQSARSAWASVWAELADKSDDTGYAFLEPFLGFLEQLASSPSAAGLYPHLSLYSVVVSRANTYPRWAEGAQVVLEPQRDSTILIEFHGTTGHARESHQLSYGNALQAAQAALARLHDPAA